MRSGVGVSVTRRTLVKAAACAGLISSEFAHAGKSTPLSMEYREMEGLVSVFNLGPVRLHSYMAPSYSAAVTTQIVETANELHIIDTQFLQALAVEVRQYADSLGKPIQGVYLSHWHPDHILGAAQFEDVHFSTTPDIRTDCENNLKTCLLYTSPSPRD